MGFSEMSLTKPPKVARRSKSCPALSSVAEPLSAKEKKQLKRDADAAAEKAIGDTVEAAKEARTFTFLSRKHFSTIEAVVNGGSKVSKEELLMALKSEPLNFVDRHSKGGCVTLERVHPGCEGREIFGSHLHNTSESRTVRKDVLCGLARDLRQCCNLTKDNIVYEPLVRMAVRRHSI